MVTAPLNLEGRAPADHCEVSTSHRPVPIRYVWHHIQPEAAGGETEDGNLAALCDSCHYSVHHLMYHIAHSLPMPKSINRHQLMLANEGYAKCVAAGTVDKIPNEG